MSLKLALSRGLDKPHISVRLNVYRSYVFGQNYNNEMARQFCYEQNKKRKVGKK